MGIDASQRLSPDLGSGVEITRLCGLKNGNFGKVVRDVVILPGGDGAIGFVAVLAHGNLDGTGSDDALDSGFFARFEEVVGTNEIMR